MKLIRSIISFFSPEFEEKNQTLELNIESTELKKLKFESMKALHQQEMDRNKTVESKASMFIGSTSIMGVIITGSAKYIFGTDENIYTMLVNAGIVLFIFVLMYYLFRTIYYSILSLKRRSFSFIEKSDFDKASTVEEYYDCMISSIEQVIERNKPIINEKVDYMIVAQNNFVRFWSYSLLYIFNILVFLLLSSFGILTPCVLLVLLISDLVVPLVINEPINNIFDSTDDVSELKEEGKDEQERLLPKWVKEAKDSFSRTFNGIKNKFQMNTFRKLTTDRFIIIIGVISMVFIVASRFWKLNKGFVFSDEGWYAVLLRDNPSQNLSSRFFKLFQFGFQDDIFALRLIFCILLLAAIAFFGYSVYRLQKSQGQNNSLLFCLSVVAIGSLQAHSISTPNYINLNLFFGLLAVSFFLLWMSNSRWYNMIASTLFASFLFTAQALGIVLLPAFFVILLFFSNKKLQDIVFSIVGILLFFSIYFMIEPPTELASKVSSTANQTVTEGSSDYGLLFLIKWSLDAILYVVKFLIGAYLFCQIINVLKKTNLSRIPLITLCVCIFCVLLLYLNVFITPHCHKSSIINFNQLGIPFFLIFLILCYSIKNINWKELFVIALLVFMPFALCLGTNTEFLARYSTFMVFLLPAIFVCSKPSNEMKKIAITYFAFTLIFSIAAVNKSAWGKNPTDQNIALTSIGINQNINLCSEDIRQLEFCKKHTIDSVPCLSSCNTWGVVSLLNYKPLNYNFRLPKEEKLVNLITETMTKQEHIVVISTVQDSLNLTNYSFEDPIVHTTKTSEGIVLDFFSTK